MDRNFCNQCGEEFPKCAMFKLPNSLGLEDFLNCNADCYQEFPVCHKNAQTILMSTMTINDSCDDCGLCQFSCPSVKREWDCSSGQSMESAVFKNFVFLAILIQTLFPHYKVGTAIQVKGNSRTKRIDVVVADNKKLVFIKVLSNTAKIPLYSRSYEEVKKNYQQEKGQDIHIACLIPERTKKTTANKTYLTYTLTELINMLGGQYGDFT